MHQLLLILHLLSATIWVGGHIILCLRYLPKSFREKSTQPITQFEKQYEVIGIPALLVLVSTGLYMAHTHYANWNTWFAFSNSLETIASVKLILLFASLVLALHARIFIIPKLSFRSLPLMAFHIILITLVGISMLVFGTFFRFGGI